MYVSNIIGTGYKTDSVVLSGQDVSRQGEHKRHIKGSGCLNAKAAAAVENARREADVRSQHVIVHGNLEE